MSDIVVHHLERSRSHRVLWLLEELGLEYELRVYPRDPTTMRAPAEMRAIHPLGKAPMVTIGDVVLAESGAILEHLVDEYDHGTLRPEAGTEAHRRYRYFLHYAEGSLAAPLLVGLIANRVRNAPVPFFLKPVVRGIADKVDAGYTTPEAALHLPFLEAELEGRAFFAGDALSAADIQMSYPLQAAKSRLGLDARYPSLLGFLARVSERPAFRRAIERGGPLELDLG